MGDLLGYMRVSTPDQDLDSQKKRLMEAGSIKIFQDVVSGKRFDRPGLNALLDYARAGDILVVVRLDRLGRSLRDLLETVERLKKSRIEFMSLEEKIDTSSAAGELVFHIFGSIAHFERRLISERTRADKVLFLLLPISLRELIFSIFQINVCVKSSILRAFTRTNRSNSLHLWLPRIRSRFSAIGEYITKKSREGIPRLT